MPVDGTDSADSKMLEALSHTAQVSFLMKASAAATVAGQSISAPIALFRYSMSILRVCCAHGQQPDQADVTQKTQRPKTEMKKCARFAHIPLAGRGIV